MSTSLLILFTVISVWALSSPVTGNMERKLIDHLFKGYSKHAHPVHNSSDVVNVIYHVTYYKVELDEVENTQTLFGSEYIHWKEKKLFWKPELYGKIQRIAIEPNFIWKPTITPYNTVSDVDAVRSQRFATIHYQGDVYLIRAIKTVVRCQFDTHYFPFDSAYCSLIMGSRVHSSWHIKLHDFNAKLSFALQKNNTLWNLVNAIVKIRKQENLFDALKYYTITYKNEFVRVSSGYVLTLLVPSFLLSILTILLFLLPNYSSEKITLGIFLFCAFFGILLYTYSVLPSTRTTPYFVVFLTFNLIMLSLVNFLNAFVVNLSNYEFCREVPKILRSVVFESIAKWFRMTSIVKRHRSRHEHDFEFSDEQSLNPSPDDQSNDEELLNENDFGRFCLQKAKDEEAEESFRQEWRDVGRVINRFFCIIYIVVVLMAVGVNIIQISSK